MRNLEEFDKVKSVSQLFRLLEDIDGVKGATLGESYTVHVQAGLKGPEEGGKDKIIPLVTIYPNKDPEKRYAQFHEPFHQIGWEMQELRPFIDELRNQGYDVNLD